MWWMAVGGWIWHICVLYMPWCINLFSHEVLLVSCYSRCHKVLPSSYWGKWPLEVDLGYRMLTTRIHYNRYVVIGASYYDVWNLKFKVPSWIYHRYFTMHACSHYLLQNFRFTAVFSLCDNTRGIPSRVVSVVILWPQKENCIYFKYLTFLCYLGLYQNLLNIYFGCHKPSWLFWFSRILCYIAGQKLSHPGNCNWIEMKRTGVHKSFKDLGVMSKF